MKLLMWHCSTLRSSDLRKSSRPRGIRALVGRPTKAEFTDVLVSFTCVEVEDGSEAIAAATREIRRLSDQIGRKEVVLVPFAHLSSRLMIDSNQAQAVLCKLAEDLRKNGLKVTVSSFGYHKKFELHYVAKGYPGSVAFRDISAPGLTDSEEGDKSS